MTSKALDTTGRRGTIGDVHGLAAQLRGWGPLGVLSVAAVLLTGTVFVHGLYPIPVGALLALAWVRASKTPWRDVGYRRPRRWAATLGGGIAFGIAFKIAMKSIVMPLLGADAINPTYHYLAGNRTMLPAAVLAMVNAGFAEETVFRGFLFERLGVLLGRARGARIAILLLTTALFAAAHYTDQGISGVEQAAFTGLAFGLMLAATGRIWAAMCAHAAFDLTALALIYLNLETAVSRLIFR